MSLWDQIRKGSTELLIMTLLLERPMYGYEIAQQLAERSEGYFEVKEGLLYPTLHRMQRNGWLKSQWQVVDGRRRKYYSLTAAGKETLGLQTAEWQTFVAKLQALIRPAEES